MAITFWTLFFMVVFLMLVVLVCVYSILDGIRYHNEVRQQRFDAMSGQEPDWVKEKVDD